MSNTVKKETVTLTARGCRMQRHSDQTLRSIIESGSLSAAAAEFELNMVRKKRVIVKGA